MGNGTNLFTRCLTNIHRHAGVPPPEFALFKTTLA